MASSDLHKAIHLMFLYMILTAPTLTLTLAAITCGQVISNLTPCVNYVLKGGSVPSNCCGGVKNVYSAATTTANRQVICQCLRSALNGVSYKSENVKNAQALPAKCGVNLSFNPYKITPQTKCNEIP